MYKVLSFFILFFLLAASAIAIPPAPWEIDELIGKPAPDFILKSVNGKETSLASFRGRIILLNFWATWCPPCKAEMPSMNKLYNLFKGRGLVVIAVSTDNSVKKVEKFLHKNPVDFVVLSDPAIKTSRKYKVFSLPTSFLIDKDGMIVKKFFGEQEWMKKYIQDEIEALF